MPDNMRVAATPVVMPKLCVYFRLHLDPSQELKPVLFKLKMMDDTEIDMGPLDLAVAQESIDETKRSGAAWAGIIARSTLAPFPIPAPGRVLALMRTGGEDIVCAAINITSPPESNG